MNTSDKEFINSMLKRMANGELKIRYQEPCRESKGTYHFAATDPDSGRTVVGVGSILMGDDFSWGFEIKTENILDYVDE